ncbi:MAG TPA: hypothetical protein VGQ42_02960 [Candidatus Dormibacteraeota bacterium]|jgi:hypothetical protein|nr:hypothetical protein [Candidatus Dormibacteraeota bacterium]
MATDGAQGELLDRLLAEPLDRFVEQRNALARELRQAGDRETATWLASLRRPAPAAWALDRVAHDDPESVRALLDLGAELREVQDRAVHGDREAAGELHRLSGRVQRAVDGIVRRAMEVMRDAGHGVSTDAALQIAATLRAALGDAKLREQLASGRLLSLTGASGFSFGLEPSGLVQLRPERADADAATAPRSRRRAGSDDADRPGDDPDAERRRAEAEGQQLRQRRARADEAARAADAADREVFQRQSEAETAQQEVSDLRTRIRALQDDLGRAEEEARTAALAVREAVEQAREVRRDADRAQASLPED